MSALDMVDQALATDPESQGRIDTPQYTRAVEDVSSALAPMLEMGNEDEREGAQIAMSEIPGLLESYGGDMEKARDEAVKSANKHADRLQSERRSKRNAAAARAAAQGRGEEFDSNAYKRGALTVRGATKAADGLTHANNFASSTDAINALDRFGDNPKVMGGLLFQAASALSGQEGRGMSDKDAEKIMGESIAEMAEGTFLQKLAGESGEIRRNQLRKLLVASREKSYMQAREAYRRSRGHAEFALSSAEGRMGGRDFAAGAESALGDYLPVIKEMKKRGEFEGEVGQAPAERGDKGKKPAATAPPDEELYDYLPPEEAAELRELTGG